MPKVDMRMTGSLGVKPRPGPFATLAWCFLCVLLAGCSEPYRTNPPKLTDSATGQRMTGLISLCYGTEMNDPEEIKAVAQEQCRGRLVFLQQNFFLNDCPLFQMTRVTYQCLPTAQGDAGRQSTAPRP